MNAMIDGYLGVLGIQSVPFSLRAELVRAHLALFESGFPERFRDAAFMWWEGLLGAEFGTPNGLPVYKDEAICAELWEVVGRILYLRSESRQMSALHGVHEIGFGKFDVKGCIGRFLESGAAVSKRVREYAGEVARGQAQ